jgi:hypothetical protein
MSHEPTIIIIILVTIVVYRFNTHQIPPRRQQQIQSTTIATYYPRFSSPPHQPQPAPPTQIQHPHTQPLRLLSTKGKQKSPYPPHQPESTHPSTRACSSKCRFRALFSRSRNTSPQSWSKLLSALRRGGGTMFAGIGRACCCCFEYGGGGGARRRWCLFLG